MKFILSIFFALLSFNIDAQYESRYLLKVDSILNKIELAKHDSVAVRNYFDVLALTKTNNDKIYFEFADKIDSVCSRQLRSNISKKDSKIFVSNIIRLHNNVAKKYMDLGKIDKAIYTCSKGLKYSDNQGFEKLRSETFNIIGLSYIEINDFEKAIVNLYNSIELRRLINDTKGIAGSLNNIGLVYYYQNDFENAIDHFKKSLKISQENNDKDFASNTLNNIGVLNKIKGDYLEAIKYYNMSMELNIEQGMKNETATCLNNIGHIHLLQGNIDKAIENYQKCLDIAKSLKKRKSIANTLNSIGLCYKKKNKEKKSIEYHIKALAIFEEIDDKRGVSMVLNNLGAMKQDLADSLLNIDMELAQRYYNQAMKYYSRSKTLSKEVNDLSSISLNNHNIGHIYYRLGQYKNAIIIGQKALEISNSIGYVEDMERDYDFLYMVHKEAGNYKKSLEMFENYSELKDSIKRKEFDFEVQRQDYQFQFEKKEELAKLEQLKKDELVLEANNRKNIILLSAVLFSLLVIIFSFFVFKRLSQIKKQNKIIEYQSGVVERQKVKVINAYKKLENKNKEVVDSIVYANRIQTAILPREKMIKEKLKEAFILFRPKQIVSGDFFWFQQKGDKLWFAVADCTGHGVPGAFMSMLGNNALKQAIEAGMRRPGHILDYLNKYVQETVHDNNHEVQVNDGMDISLCQLNLKTKELQMAGAMNEVYVIRNGELKILSADRQPVGHYIESIRVPFKTNHMQLQSGDCIYLFSDGYYDQFGGEKGRKLKIGPFKKMITNISGKPMENQYEILKNHLHSWMGNEEQVDDICIMGIRV